MRHSVDGEFRLADVSGGSRISSMYALRLPAKALLILVSLFFVCEARRAAAQSCGFHGLAVQVLGSGGPEL